MSKKGVVGLSMNVLVVIIISLVILGLGVSMLYSFIGGAQDIKDKLDAKTSQELERLLVNQGKMVALPLHVASVERGNDHIFGIGIMNIGNVGNSFHINIPTYKVINEDNVDVTTSVDVSDWLLFNDEEITILEGDHVKEIIAVIVPKDAVKGQYIFTARVYAGENPYGNKQTFIVNVI